MHPGYESHSGMEKELNGQTRYYIFYIVEEVEGYERLEI